MPEQGHILYYQGRVYSNVASRESFGKINRHCSEHRPEHRVGLWPTIRRAPVLHLYITLCVMLFWVHDGVHIVTYHDRRDAAYHGLVVKVLVVAFWFEQRLVARRGTGCPVVCLGHGDQLIDMLASTLQSN